MAESKPYFSILICDRPGVIEIYANGLKLGDVKNGSFTADPLFDRRNPFATPEQIAVYLRSMANHFAPAIYTDAPERLKPEDIPWCFHCATYHFAKDCPLGG